MPIMNRPSFHFFPQHEKFKKAKQGRIDLLLKEDLDPSYIRKRLL